MKNLISLGLAAWSLACSAQAGAHAFPQQAIPPAGAVVNQVPAQVSIRFDAQLEPILSRLVVKDSHGVQVSRGNGQVRATEQNVLETALPALPPAVYHAWWRVVSRDGHSTEGDYSFTVR